MSQSVHYISNNREVISILREYMQTQDVDFKEYSISKPPKAEILLLVEPVLIDSDWYAVSTAWKPWLFEFYPNIRLIVAAFAQSSHSNCLNLLDLPTDWSGWLAQTKPINGFRLEEMHPEKNAGGETTYEDPWELDLVNPGIELKRLMQKFIEGHDKSKNLYSQVSDIRRTLQDIQHHVSNPKKKGEAIKECDKLWDYFLHRWVHYSRIFQFVPYQKAIKNITKNVGAFKDQMAAAAETGTYPDIQLLDHVIETINKEINPYIFPEKYW